MVWGAGGAKEDEDETRGPRWRAEGWRLEGGVWRVDVRRKKADDRDGRGRRADGSGHREPAREREPARARATKPQGGRCTCGNVSPARSAPPVA
eukprot:7364763-Prymnesium_polylepis.1